MGENEQDGEEISEEEAYTDIISGKAELIVQYPSND